MTPVAPLEADLLGLAPALARVFPVALVLPRVALPAAPAGLSLALGAVLAVAVAPAISVGAPGASPHPSALLADVLVGVPVAVSAAVPSVVARSAGGVLAVAVGAPGAAAIAEQALGLLGLAVALSTGGAVRLAAALSTSPDASDGLLRSAVAFARAVGAGTYLAMPLVAAAAGAELLAALSARWAPGGASTTGAPALRAVIALVLASALLDRIAEELAAAAAGP